MYGSWAVCVSNPRYRAPGSPRLQSPRTQMSSPRSLFAAKPKVRVETGGVVNHSAQGPIHWHATPSRHNANLSQVCYCWVSLHTRRDAFSLWLTACTIVSGPCLGLYLCAADYDAI